MNFVQNILWNSVEGFVEAGTRTAGGYAGDALIKAGDMIENSGRSVGTGIERRASNYGSSITGQSYQPSAKALPSTARKPAIKRSNSLPPNTKSIAPTSKTPIGAKKAGAARKQLTGAAGGAQKQLTGAAGGAQKQLTGAAGGAQKALGGAAGAAKKSLPKPYPNNMPYGTKTPPPSKPASTSNLLPSSSYAPSSAGGGSGKKKPVKPHAPRPFVPPEETAKKEDDKKKAPYPGTNTLPGQASRTPARAKKYKPMERLGAQTERGKVQHIAV
ncbi:hypothetical protein BS50DRAFT_79157 [Corynespora cassiicola Philippines]|uniref:Uncharacterized protein n=1 Tax=Corynespora cassiicola Philippines TaxID=1448308 RepID=A0A2T2NGV6_CORCC|nr:hypothetical protein BS50DRAFT_79157 [Corynespora cassiicola Philippines]